MVVEVAVAAALAVVAGLIWSLVLSSFPRADPSSAASRQLGEELASHRTTRQFLRARLDPEAVAGLSLTIALVGVLLVFVVFGVFVAMIRSSTGVVSVDVAITHWAAVHATDASVFILTVVTMAGGTPVVIAAGVATAAYALRAWRRWSAVLFLLAVLAGQLALSNLVKIAVERVRPDAPPFHVLTGPSFPSGHATAAAATWAAVALVLSRGRSPRARVILGGVAVGIAVAVACSRVFLGAHWTSDVIGGLLLGWTWYALCAVAFGGRVLRLGAPAEQATAAPAPSGAALEREKPGR